MRHYALKMRLKHTFSLILTSMMFVGILQPAHATPIYAFPIDGCAVKYAHSHHNYPATDILTKKRCHFVATTSGIVDEVNREDKWNGKSNLGADRGGLFVSIIGDDGVRYYGSHLGKVTPRIVHGLRVSAGDLLGYIGTSGDARGTAPHVHYGISWPTPSGIWWVRRGEVYPWKYLEMRKAPDFSGAFLSKVV